MPKDLSWDFGEYIMSIDDVPDFNTSITKSEAPSSDEDAHSRVRGGPKKYFWNKFPRIFIEQRMHDPETKHIAEALQMIAFAKTEKP